MSFETLKRNRGSNINKIIQAAEATSSGEQKSYVDERIWKPTVDKLVTVMLSLDSYQVKMVRFLLSDIGTMALKVQPAYGILKTL